MKTFHHKHGAPSLITLTVGELMEVLAQHPRDMPVLAEWEGQRMPLGVNRKTESFSAGMASEACECLVLDAEYGGQRS